MARSKQTKFKPSGLFSVRNLLLYILVFAVIGGLYLAYRSFAESRANFANIWVGKITPGPGHVGVDIWWKANGKDYNPCQAERVDSNFGGCEDSNVKKVVYYKVYHFKSDGSNDFPYGIFIDNTNANHCRSSSWCAKKTSKVINHNWGQKITGAALEIYPYTKDIGAVRATIDSFPNEANGGRYSVNIGDIKLPKFGDRGIGQFNGFAFYNGKAVSNKRVTIDAFQTGGTPLKSSTGFPLYGFSTSSSNKDGYFTTTAIPNGSYRIYITDHKTNHKVVLDGVHVTQLGQRLDMYLDKPCFGHAEGICDNSGNK